MWDKSVDSIIDDIDKHCLETYKKFAMACYNNLVALSPVDTGRYRRNHIVSVGAPSYAIDSQGGFNFSFGDKHQIIYIQNNLPYVLRIEHGHSKQAPSGVYQNAFNSALGSL